jgi:hypothetical protein
MRFHYKDQPGNKWLSIAKITSNIQTDSSSSIRLSRDRSIAPSKLRFPKSAILSLSPDEESRIFFGERLSRKSCNVVVFPFAYVGKMSRFLMLKQVVHIVTTIL